MARHDPRELASIFAGGMLGALARVWVGTELASRPTSWPWSTFLVNIVGAVILGYAVTRLQERLPLSTYRRPFIGTGFCGALTTFSTMQVEIVKMLQLGRDGLAVGYAAGSIGAGLFAVWLTTALVRRLRWRT